MFPQCLLFPPKPIGCLDKTLVDGYVRWTSQTAAAVPAPTAAAAAASPATASPAADGGRGGDDDNRPTAVK